MIFERLQKNSLTKAEADVRREYRNVSGSPGNCLSYWQTVSGAVCPGRDVRSHDLLICFVSRRACLKNHSCQLHDPLCGIFSPHPVNAAHYIMPFGYI